MRRGYVVPMRWMVIYEYGVPGGALNLNSTNYRDHGHQAIRCHMLVHTLELSSNTGTDLCSCFTMACFSKTCVTIY
jgi:hypothetical protein